MICLLFPRAEHALVAATFAVGFGLAYLVNPLIG